MRRIFNFANISLLSVMVLTLYISCSNRETNTHTRLAGMYKLSLIENFDSTIKIWHEDELSKGDSYIIYDGLGHMAVHITPKGYKDFIWLPEKQAMNNTALAQYIDSMSVDQLKAALVEFSTSFVYTANYTIDNSSKIVTHDRLSGSIPSVWGMQVKRYFSFSGDTLTLTFLDRTKRLKWVKQP